MPLPDGEETRAEMHALIEQARRMLDRLAHAVDNRGECFIDEKIRREHPAIMQELQCVGEFTLDRAANPPRIALKIEIKPDQRSAEKPSTISPEHQKGEVGFDYKH